MTRRVFVGALRVALVLAAVAFGLCLQAEGGNRRALPRLIASNGVLAVGAFTITGSVEGLYPGANTMLPLRVRNNNGFAMVVRELDVATTQTDRAGCATSSVLPTGFDGSVRVNAKSAVTIPVPVRMLQTVTDACQGASFTLRYSGTATVAPIPTSLTAATVTVRRGATRPPSRFAAVLFERDSRQPVVGRRLTFRVDGNVACRATTGDDGRASCDALVSGAVPTVYIVRFAGDSTYEAAAGQGALKVVRT